MLGVLAMKQPVQVLRPSAIYVAACECLYRPWPKRAPEAASVPAPVPAAPPAPVITHRVCATCKTAKDLAEFVPKRNARGRQLRRCRTCIEAEERRIRYAASVDNKPAAVPSTSQSKYAVRSSLDQRPRTDGRLLAHTALNVHGIVPRGEVPSAVARYMRALTT